MCMRGKRPAVITAKTVIASAILKIPLLHFDLKRCSTAEIRVPECAIPTQKTKLTIKCTQKTGGVNPAAPIPTITR